MVIRIAQEQDVAGILEIYRPFIIEGVATFEVEVPSYGEFWERIQKVLKETPWLVAELDNKIVGYAYATKYKSRSAYEWSREISVYVHPDFHRKGIARKLYDKLMNTLIKQGYKNLLAGIVLPNEASIRLHQSYGFELVGVFKDVGYKFGQYHDVGMYQMRIGDDTPPKKVLHWTEVS